MWQPLGDRFHEKRRTLREISWTIALGDPWRCRCRSQPLAIGMFLCDPSSKGQIASSLFLTPTLMDLGACPFDLALVSATGRSPMQPPGACLGTIPCILRVIAQPTVLGAPWPPASLL